MDAGGGPVIETERLVLRHWADSDAPALFALASDPAIGPAAGWSAHGSVAESLESIRTVLAGPDIYAVCLRATGELIGCVSLVPPRCRAEFRGPGRELELGYWVGRPFWGHGDAPEAVRAAVDRAFMELGCSGIWCGYFEGNERSRRVMEKCGFSPHHTEHDVRVAPLAETRTEHFMYLSKRIDSSIGTTRYKLV